MTVGDLFDHEPVIDRVDRQEGEAVMTAADRSSSATRAADRTSLDEPSEWTGRVVFADILMIMMGACQAIVGLVALLDDDYFVVRPEGLAVNLDYTAWGWVQLLLGLFAFLAGLAIFAGFGVLSRPTWARAVGITLAGVAAVVNYAFVAAFPIWATILIAIDVLIIYALAAHGRELPP